MKSPRAAPFALVLLAGLEDVLRDREHLLLGHPLDERRDEAVVDDDRPVDLLGGVELGQPVRDRLRVGVGRPVAEAGPGLLELVAAERRASSGPSSPRRATRTSAPSARSSRSSANARRRTWALNAPARPRSPVSGTIATRRTSRRWSSGSPRTDVLGPRGARPSAPASGRRTAASPRSAPARGAAAPRRRAPSPS